MAASAVDLHALDGWTTPYSQPFQLFGGTVHVHIYPLLQGAGQPMHDRGACIYVPTSTVTVHAMHARPAQRVRDQLLLYFIIWNCRYFFPSLQGRYRRCKLLFICAAFFLVIDDQGEQIDAVGLTCSCSGSSSVVTIEGPVQFFYCRGELGSFVPGQSYLGNMRKGGCDKDMALLRVVVVPPNQIRFQAKYLFKP